MRFNTKHTDVLFITFPISPTEFSSLFSTDPSQKNIVVFMILFFECMRGVVFAVFPLAYQPLIFINYGQKDHCLCHMKIQARD